MELSKFITNVLNDIQDGMINANEKLPSDMQYKVLADKEGGVIFDIAVTTTSSTSSEKKGGAGIEIIKVFKADLGGEKGKSKSDSQLSRIKFTVKEVFK